MLQTARGRALAERLPADADEWVPEIYPIEVAAGLRRAELSGRITADRAALALKRLLEGTQRRVEVTALLPEAWTLRHNLTVTDAVYVVLARHVGAVLVTADHRLAGAPGLGIDVITPPAGLS